MSCKWQVEIDPYCQRILEKHWPDVARFPDVYECGAHNLEPVDLIAGGFPCQPVSQAGKRKGLDDERWLWTEFARIISEIKPRWVLAENVPGLLSANSGRAMGTVLRDLARLGYYAEWDSIPAAAFGAPHLRYRVFIVAHRNGSGYFHRQAIFKPAEPWEQTFCQPGTSCEDVANSKRMEMERFQEQATITHKQDWLHWWATEPNVGRVAHGVPARVDRLRALGNAVVPQITHWIGSRIMVVDNDAL